MHNISYFGKKDHIILTPSRFDIFNNHTYSTSSLALSPPYFKRPESTYKIKYSLRQPFKKNKTPMIEGYKLAKALQKKT